MSETQEAFGRPIVGEIPRYTQTITQDDPQKFIEALDELLNFPRVEAVKWEGSTPSWNDGDPCTFNIHFRGVKIAGTADEDGDYEDGFVTSWSIQDKDLKRAVKNFESVIDSGKHDLELNRLFGDPSVVTATKEGFTVEYTEPD